MLLLFGLKFLFSLRFWNYEHKVFYNFAYKSGKFRLCVPKSLFGLHVFLSFPSLLAFFSSFLVGRNLKVLLDGNGGDVEQWIKLVVFLGEDLYILLNSTFFFINNIKYNFLIGYIKKRLFYWNRTMYKFEKCSIIFIYICKMWQEKYYSFFFLSLFLVTGHIYIKAWIDNYSGPKFSVNGHQPFVFTKRIIKIQLVYYIVK